MQAMQKPQLKHLIVRLCLLLLFVVNNAEMSCIKVIGKAPENFLSYRHRVGKCFEFILTGTKSGIVRGSNVYRADSSLGKAAVLAGLVRPGQSALVNVQVLPGLKSYLSSTHHGVTSLAYNHLSYRFLGVHQAHKSTGSSHHHNSCLKLPTPESMKAYSQSVGKCFEFSVNGTTSGTVWGSGVYTGDSSLGKAAVHAGLVKPGHKTVVRVLVLPGRFSYPSSTHHGVTSHSYIHLSYRFMRGQAHGSSGSKKTQTKLK